jgi:hypothetical protein
MDDIPLSNDFPLIPVMSLSKKAGENYASNIALLQLITNEVTQQPYSICFSRLASQVTQAPNLLHQMGVKRNGEVKGTVHPIPFTVNRA